MMRRLPGYGSSATGIRWWLSGRSAWIITGIRSPMIHSREAAQDTMDIMREKAQGIPGVIHCFSYSPEMAKEYVRMGYYIGVGGVVTFKNAKKLKETVQQVPLERILLETDCPYLAPVPYRGKRNCSLYLPYVAKEIADLKGVSLEEVTETTERNARALYGL